MQRAHQNPDRFDTLLLFVFLVGLYLNVAVMVGPGTPIPAVGAGAAAGILLLRHASWIEQRHLIGLIGISALYLLSVFWAPDMRMLDERMKGIFQLVYSLVLGYAFYIVARRFARPRLARLFLVLCLLLLVGTALENYTGLKAVSDSVRAELFTFGNYDSDLRDEAYYGMVRPKLFTSEPSYLAYGFTLFAFGWYALATWRFKLPIYMGIVAAGYLLMRSPTIFLGPMLVLPYEIFLASKRPNGRGYDLTRVILMLLIGAAILGIAAWAASNILAVRLQEIQDGGDPSFFSREIGPALVAQDTFQTHPLTGIGITSEEYIADRLLTIFQRSAAFSADWNVGSDPALLLTNYFWYHWIYFGLMWGLILLIGFNWFLRQLGVSGTVFCWTVWVLFGQSMGAYVSPRVWFVMFLAATIVALHQSAAAGQRRPRIAATASARPASRLVGT